MFNISIGLFVPQIVGLPYCHALILHLISAVTLYISSTVTRHRLSRIYCHRDGQSSYCNYHLPYSYHYTYLINCIYGHYIIINSYIINGIT